MEEYVISVLTSAHHESDSVLARRFIVDVLCYFVVSFEESNDETNFQG